MVEWLPLSMRSFISSKGRTSATSCAPAISNGGRPVGKRSSMTHWLKGSVTTGQASATPVVSQYELAVGVGGCRNDAVDHRRGERDLAGDVIGQSWVAQPGKAGDDARRRLAIGREVVAAEHRERCSPAWICALPAHRTIRPGALTGACGMREIVQNVGMARIQLSGRRIVAIAFLGDRERDDADARIDHRRNEVAPLGGGIEDVENGPDDTDRRARAAPHSKRVEEVLRRQGISRVGPPQARHR